MVHIFRDLVIDGTDNAMTPDIDPGGGSRITTQDGRTGDQHDCSSPDCRDSNIRDREEHEDRGSGVQQPSGTAPERTSSCGQDDGGAHDKVQSGKSEGKSPYSGHMMVRIDGTTSQGERLG